MPSIIGVKAITSTAKLSQDVSTKKEDIERVDRQAHKIINLLNSIREHSNGNIQPIISGNSNNAEDLAFAVIKDVKGIEEGALRVNLEKTKIDRAGIKEAGTIQINLASMNDFEKFLIEFQGELTKEESKRLTKPQLMDMFEKNIERIAAKSEATEIETPKNIPVTKQAKKQI